jgi:hypothetical protein
MATIGAAAATAPRNLRREQTLTTDDYPDGAEPMSMPRKMPVARQPTGFRQPPARAGPIRQ